MQSQGNSHLNVNAVLKKNYVAISSYLANAISYKYHSLSFLELA